MQIKKCLAVSCWRLAVSGCWLGAMAFTAQAEVWSTDRTTALDVGTKPYEITVESGKTVKMNGTITGSAAIIKKGLGTLLITSANDNFSGGFVIEKGYLTASNATALGTAAVTICGQTSANKDMCSLGLWGVGKGDKTVITYANAINITGNTSLARPGLLVFGQNAVLTGKVTAIKDFIFYEDATSTAAINKSYSDRSDNVTSLTFGEVEAGGMVQSDGWTRFNFAGKLKATAFSSQWNRGYDVPSGSSNRKAKYDFRGAVDVQVITNGCRDILVSADGVINGSEYIILENVSSRAKFQLCGHDIKLASLSVKYSTDQDTTATENSFLNSKAYGYVTLTLDGGKTLGDTTAKTVSCAAILREAINLNVDAFEGFTQIFTNRAHTMSGTLTVNNGAVEVRGNARFQSLPKIVVGEAGKLTIDTTYASAFKSVSSMTVNGELKVSSTTVTPFLELSTLTLGANGKVDMDGGSLEVKTLTVNGTALSGIFTHEDYPDNIAEGTTIYAQGNPIVYTDTDKTSAGDWTVFVAAGCSNVVRVAQTGTGKIVKIGAGTLVLTTENSYTGGTTISAGYVRVETNNVFGMGEITILGQRGNYSGPCEIDMIGCPKVNSALTYHTTITNDIHITGNSTPTYPCINGFYNGSVVNGKITAEQDFCFIEDYNSMYYGVRKSCYDAWSYITTLTFGGDIQVGGMIKHDGWARFDFKGKVTAGQLYCSTYRTENSNYNTHYYFYEDVNFGTITNRKRSMEFYNGVTVTGLHYGLPTDSGNGEGKYAVTGSSQQFGGFSDTGTTDENLRIWTASGNNTLTITGVTPEVPTEVSTGIKFNGAMSIVLDASDNFTQTFSNRVNLMTGSITVKKGTFRLVGTATFANVTALTVKSGAKFLDLSTAAKSFSALKTLVIEDGATVTLPAGLTLNLDTFTYHGNRLPPGTYTDPTVFGFPATTTLSVSKVPAATTVAVWVGGGSDNKMSTMENWLVNGVKPESIDFTSGTTTVRIDSGTEMIPHQDGLRLHSITNNRVYASGVGTFYVGTVGKTLCVDGQIISINKAAFALRGTIAPSFGAVQTGSAGATENGPCCITHFNPNKSNGLKGFYFAGATIKKPLYMRATDVGGAPYYGAAGTTNLILGYLAASGSANNQPVVEANGLLEIAGGYSQGYRPWRGGTGTLKFSTTPISIDTGFSVAIGTLELAVTNNQFLAYGEDEGNVGQLNRGIRIDGSGNLKFSCSNALKDNDKEQLQLTGSTVITVDFGGTTQRISRVIGSNTHSQSAMTGVCPAMLEVKGGTKWTAAKYFVGLTNNVNIAGGMGFHYLGNGPAQSTYGAPAGSEDVYVLKSRNFSTCGNLEVSGGTLELASDATWLNGTNFVASGTGTLRFTAAGQVNSDIAALRLADTGKVEIPEGVALRVNSAWLDGQAVEEGTYQEGDTGIAAHIAGGGTLKVGKKGTTLYLW